MSIDIGIGDNARKEIGDGLAKVLADTYFLYLKTHGYHWNVKGPHFGQLHGLFEEQYRELWDAVDEIAERIRALGHDAPGSYAALAKLASVEESESVPDASGMLADLVKGNEAVLKTVRAMMPSAQEGGDEATFDLMVERLSAHEKAAWMLRSHLG
ncbi:MAG: Dps family protein [Rhodospirillales bacterium]